MLRRRRIDARAQAAQVRRHVRREDRLVGDGGVQHAQLARLAVRFEVGREQRAQRLALGVVERAVLVPRQQFVEILFMVGGSHCQSPSIWLRRGRSLARAWNMRDFTVPTGQSRIWATSSYDLFEKNVRSTTARCSGG